MLSVSCSLGCTLLPLSPSPWARFQKKMAAKQRNRGWENGCLLDLEEGSGWFREASSCLLDTKRFFLTKKKTF